MGKDALKKMWGVGVSKRENEKRGRGPQPRSLPYSSPFRSRSPHLSKHRHLQLPRVCEGCNFEQNSYPKKSPRVGEVTSAFLEGRRLCSAARGFGRAGRRSAYQPPCRGQLTEKCLWAGKVVSQELPGISDAPCRGAKAGPAPASFTADCEEGRDAFSASNHVGQFGRK